MSHRHRNSRRPQLLAIAGVLLVVTAMAVGDVVTLKNGTRLEGDIKRDGDNWVVTAADGSKTVVKGTDVKGIELVAKPGAQADAGLASLRRSADAQTDAAKVIERYKQFIQVNKGTPAAEQAQTDLALWEERLAKGQIKIGGKWVDAAEALVIRGQATALARQAMDMLRQSRMADAEAAIAAALEADPQNPTALYLKGVVAYRQDKFQDARKAFDATVLAAPGHGPTLANFAIVTFQLKQYGVALGAYDQALVVMPLERGLLNNVAEALQALPDNQKNTPVAKRVQKKFQEQDTLLAQQLAQQGLYRWGATWVNDKQLAELKDAERKAKEKLDQLAGQYDALTRKISVLDSQIKSNTEELRRIEAQCFSYDARGTLVQLPLPAVYYTVKQEGDRLRAEREAAVSEQTRLRSQARDAQKETPVPKYTGIQQLYAAEAAPMPAITPTTRP